MRVKVLKPFPFAESRQRTRMVAANEELTLVDADVAAGLIDGGYVAELSGGEAKPRAKPRAKPEAKPSAGEQA